MSKTVTIRLSNDDYKAIADAAQHERRPISNFITHRVMEAIANMNMVDNTEMNEILADKKVVRTIEAGRDQLARGKGRFVV